MSKDLDRILPQTVSLRSTQLLPRLDSNQQNWMLTHWVRLGALKPTVNTGIYAEFVRR